MISIVSCRTQIYCAQIESAKIKPLILKDINIKFNRCRARCFDFNTWDALPDNKCPDFPKTALIEGLTVYGEPVYDKNGKIDKGVNFPIEYCDGIGGFSNVDMADEVKPKIKKLNSIKTDLCSAK